PGAVGDVTAIIDGCTFDHNINLPDGFAMQERTKLIRFHDRRPYGWHEGSARYVRFAALHCQGDAKQILPRLSTFIASLQRLQPELRSAGAISVSALRPPIEEKFGARDS